MTDGSAPLAVVTGAAGGIGRAVTAALTASGHRVLGVDVDPAGDPEAYASLVADVAVPEQVEQLFAGIRERYGLPTVLVNNAGIYHARAFLDYDPKTYAQVFDVNVGAAFFCTQAFARALISAGRPGTVVNVASISGQSGSPDAAYGASKGACIALTHSLGRALAEHRIRVNAVAPGLVDTPMAARIPARRRDDYRARIPVGRFGTPAEVAAAVAWLADPASSYVTATVVDVNGGLH
ncbi:SDR family NAD(P)-dependent oxidoreductase [Micromonospora lupini]|uniref:Short-chain dehydrogenase/reductase SDR n=1 Tax=Micromonospora lupini str. Lupac 08 TaxID=1150864 RepID=I0L298_9ACTN|nr:SDR family NAD(P)-dependent oxidoreductase [Micromonospora lupini]CCH17945.1 Short-chain dehydrogenase/reductase SDR [Micromonospora lupini str. Lupac 08]